MSWIFLAAGAQFLLAVVALIDKYIVSEESALPKPFVYAFYTLLLSGVWVVVFLFGLFPFSIGGVSAPSFANVVKPTLEVVALSFLAAYTFFLAIVSMFTALKDADASDVVPVIGAISALGSFMLSYYFLSTSLSPNFIWGVGLLATGTFLVSRLRFPLRIALLSLHAGLFFALHHVALKGLFTVTDFDNGFFWSRVAFVFFALSLLLVPTYYARIKEQTASTGSDTRILIFVNKVLAGIATILILKATDLGDVAVVQALGGLQFVFILLLGIVLGGKRVKICKEESCRTDEVLQKAIFVAIISLGFLVLFR